MHHPTDRITHTTAIVTPVVEHWLEREIAQWVHPMKDRPDDPSHHERTLYLRATSRSACDRTYTNALIKSQGGLTRGSGISEHQRASWTMSSTVSSSYNLALQELTTNRYTTGEQHKELSTSRVSRDEVYLVTVATKLDRFTLFSDDESMVISSQGYCNWDCQCTWPIHNRKWPSQEYG